MGKKDIPIMEDKTKEELDTIGNCQVTCRLSQTESRF